MTNYHHNLIHAICGLVMIGLVYIIIKPEKEVQTVPQSIYDAKLLQIENQYRLIDSLAIVNGHLYEINDSIEKAKPKVVYIHKNRNNEIELFNHSELHDNLLDEIAGYKP